MRRIRRRRFKSLAEVWPLDDHGYGPIGRLCGMSAIALTVLVGMQAITLPSAMSFGILVLALGALLNAPADAMRRFPLSVSAIAFVTWVVFSIRWTNDPVVSTFFLRRDLPLYVAMAIAAGLASLPDAVKAFNIGMRMVVAWTLFQVATSPLARVHIDPTGESPPLPGWHGDFLHKNSMTPVLLIGLCSILAFDRSRWPRFLTIGGIAALVIGSDSVTGLAGVALVVFLWVWIWVYRQTEHRFGTALVLSTVAVIASFVTGIALSLQSVVEAYGKDITFTGRTFIWSAVVEAIEQRPWFGWGLGGILWGSEPPTVETQAVWRNIGFRVPHAHNGVLDLILQFGLIGMAIYAVLFVSVLAGGWRLLRASHLVGAFAVASLLTLAFVSISEPVFTAQWLLLLLFVQQLVLRATQAERRREPLDI